MKNVTIGDMANALALLKEKYGYDYKPSKDIIFNTVLKIKDKGDDKH